MIIIVIIIIIIIIINVVKSGHLSALPPLMAVYGYSGEVLAVFDLHQLCILK